MPVEITQTLPHVGVPPDPMIGLELKETYRIIRQIGAGGMGTIYEAVHVHLPKRFALKVMLPEVAADQVSFERFRREAVATSSLGNPHIAEVVDFNLLPDGSPYMVMEYLEGEDLATRLASKGRLDPGQVSSLIANVASALTSAHAKAIFHRDIKPPNIFLARRPDGGEVVKLLDFGAAKSKRAHDLTAKGMVMGTPWYMSPEQARGHELDARSDEFSLAVVAYEALCGRLPFDDPDPTQVLFRIVDDPPVPLSTYNPNLPEDVGRVIEKALSKAREDRYPTVEAFASHLTSALGADTVNFRADVAMPLPAAKAPSPAAATITLPVRDHAAPPTDPDGDAVPRSGEKRGPMFLGLGAMVVVVGVGGFLLWGRSGPTAPTLPPVTPSARLPVEGPPVQTPQAEAPPVPPPATPREPSPIPATPSPARRPSPPATRVAPTPPAPPAPVEAPHPAPIPERAPRASVGALPAAAPKAAVPLVAAPDSAPKMGWLTLDTTPWTQVYEGNKYLGDTPLARVALPAGTHQLRLANPDQNVKQAVEVVIQPDKTTVTRLEF